ncbi:hypothetical protein [Corynebacterium durum]|uniref:hypothetical protein n=1 Tax=Corynebacterium durum TaxID=61592 RepID=UPI0040267C44
MTSELDKTKEWFAALAEGGNITMPISNAPLGDYFGNLQDHFSVKLIFSISTQS